MLIDSTETVTKGALCAHEVARLAVFSTMALASLNRWTIKHYAWRSLRNRNELIIDCLGPWLPHCGSPEKKSRRFKDVPGEIITTLIPLLGLLHLLEIRTMKYYY